MKKRSLMLLAVALTVCSAISTTAARKDEITLVMVPRGEETERLGMDLVDKYGSMLLRYKTGANQAVSLHGWTGTQWVMIRPEAFQQGDFFRKGPGSAVIVEEAGKTVPSKMIPPAQWCPTVSKITTTEMRPLLHLTGRYYDISYKDWKWFAKRYNMSVDDINPEGLNIAWYHRRLAENLTIGQQDVYDQQYWVSVRRPVERTAVAPVVEERAADTGISGNPLTNEAPEAVIMGAGDAEEEQAEVVEDQEKPSPEEGNAPKAEAEAEAEAEIVDTMAEIPEVEAEEAVVGEEM